MEVLTPAEASLSRRSLLVAAAGAALSGVIVAPGIAFPRYAGVGATALLAFGLVLSARVAVSTAVAALPRRPPPAVPDGDLPSVSVVVTAYNEADVLPETLRACTALDYPDWKLDVVVGYEAASSDGTGALARAAADGDPRVVAVERDGPPGGKASATNHALDHADGEVVAVLDADQRPEPGALRRAVRWFGDPAVACVKGRCHGTNPGDSLVALCATVERAVAERTEFYARDRLWGFPFFTGGQAFVRAGVFEEVGRFDESILLEDLDMACRIRRAGGEVRVDPGVVTRETNPTSVAAWWSQRRRWARGGMQVARRYLGAGLLASPPPLRARADLATTLVALLALPVFALGSPLLAVAAWHGVGPFPLDAVTAASLAPLVLAPVAVAYPVFAVDRRDGLHHGPREYLAPPLLWPYFGLQGLAVVAAFLAEFVVRRPAVYVTSTAPGGK